MYGNKFITNPVHLIRYHSYKSIESELSSEHMTSGLGLTISDWNPILNKNFPRVEFTNLPYPIYDIQNLHQIPDNYADVVYSEMVLEHISNPEAAISEIFRILKPGGIVIHTTVFIMPYHPSPNDYWRFSSDALKLMHYKYKTVKVGGYGNRRSIAIMLLRFTRFPVMYSTKFNFMTFLLKGNNQKFPIVTWVIAKK